MRDSELRGIILAALYNQRRRDPVSLDQELGGLRVPSSATESILRQLEKKGLIERPFRPLSGLGNGRITQEGIEVIEGKRSSPVSILFQHVNSQTDTDNIQKVSDTKLNVTIDHSQASQDKPKSPFGWISKWVMDMLEKFGWI